MKAIERFFPVVLVPQTKKDYPRCVWLQTRTGWNTLKKLVSILQWFYKNDRQGIFLKLVVDKQVGLKKILTAESFSKPFRNDDLSTCQQELLFTKGWFIYMRSKFKTTSKSSLV